jgi:hypothetical protein
VRCSGDRELARQETGGEIGQLGFQGGGLRGVERHGDGLVGALEEAMGHLDLLRAVA